MPRAQRICCDFWRTVRTMSEHIDVDVSGILRRDMTLEEAGDILIEMILRTAMDG